MLKNELKAIRAAFPYTVAVFAGYFPLGVACGVFVRSQGFPFFLPVINSILIFSGTNEFLIPSLLISAFSPLETFFLSLAVSSRHIFYGLTTLDIYHGAKLRKPYLIYSTADEAFSIHCTIKTPLGIDEYAFRMYVNLLNQSYWVLSVLLGSTLGSFIHFNTEGMDFALTALFLVMFINFVQNAKEKISSLIGLIICFLSLLILGPKNFMLPSLVFITATLLLLRGKLDEQK